MSITQETRGESYDAVLPFVGNIAARVYAAVAAASDGLTAEDVQRAVGCSLNSARSRLTELTQAGRLQAWNKRRNAANTRDIAVYYVPSPSEAKP